MRFEMMYIQKNYFTIRDNNHNQNNHCKGRMKTLIVQNFLTLLIHKVVNITEYMFVDGHMFYILAPFCTRC